MQSFAELPDPTANPQWIVPQGDAATSPANLGNNNFFIGATGTPE